MPIHHQSIEKISIMQLKGLQNIEVSFKRDGLTGIFGVNGSGKSTILHALACFYKPDGINGEDHHYTEFFKTSAAQSWIGSSFSVSYTQQMDGNPIETKAKKIQKRSSHWMRTYLQRPIRPVYYIGISSCMPDVERLRSNQTKIHILPGNAKVYNNEALDIANHVLSNMNYTEVDTKNSAIKSNGQFLYATNNGTSYTSLSMGAGEQRLMRVIDTVVSAPSYSLILIDEIDLTLHTAALLRLMEKLKEKAERKHLQIIFTSHREELCKLDYVETRHLLKMGTYQTVLEKSTPECIDRLTGSVTRPLDIFVEDDFAKAIVSELLSEKRIIRRANIFCFGSCANAFSCATGLEVKGELDDNKIFLLDGDKYRTEEEKVAMINRIFSGTELNHNQRVNNILAHVKQFVMPEGTSPDEFVNQKLREINDGSEVVTLALQTGAPQDKHMHTKYVIDNMGLSEEMGFNHIIAKFKEDDAAWNDFTQEIRTWVDGRIVTLHLR